ncbi:hypothetical protein ES703_122534 [subsurface metagenome]
MKGHPEGTIKRRAMGKIACKVFEVLVLWVLYLIMGLIDAWWALRKWGKKKRG